ncbi:hypothetical protein [Candidatus Bathycorpusculum sp.]|uniref:hypothetical protein n=1 Tax=Candidatus Bathycorpusculum sp. TaxID=2994959 RepID=UPI002818FA0E|nr:hypothetical protein [Candidatus Termitimicrobium sp.]MCL2432186.1 hypothetical protein [Candidatus Termitimicrobium sp.]
MKIEQKVTSFIMLVIIIGLAVITPIHLVSAKTDNACPATNSSATQENCLPPSIDDDPLSTSAEYVSTQTPLGSSVNITYAYADLNYTDSNGSFSWNGAKIHIMANISLTSEVNLEHADGKMEFYMFHLYSEQGSIANITFSIAFFKSPRVILGSTAKSSPINGSGGNVVYFKDGTIFDANKIIGDNFCTGGGSFNSYSYKNRAYIVIGAGPLRIGFEENHAQVLAALRSAQTLYIDATRVLCITCQENEDLMITPTLFSNEVLCHVELTKVGDRFGYGAYTGTEYDYPMPERPFPENLLPEENYTYVIAVVLLLIWLFFFL